MSTGKMTRAERAEARARVAECQSTIRGAKRGVATDLVAYKQAANELRKAAIVFNKASRAYDRRPNGKNEVKYNAAKAELAEAIEDVKETLGAEIDGLADRLTAVEATLEKHASMIDDLYAKYNTPRSEPRICS